MKLETATVKDSVTCIYTCRGKWNCVPCRVHAVAVPVPGCVPIQDLQTDMELLGVGGMAPTDILDVIEGYDGEGYGIADRELKGISMRQM